MQHLEVSGAVRHIYIYIIRRLKVKHQAGKKKFERRTLEIHLLLFTLTVDGFRWEALDCFSLGKASRMPWVLIGWIQW